MRLDSHHQFSIEHPPAHLEAVLKRNRFDGSILIVDEGLSLPAAGLEFIKGVVMRVDLADPRLGHRLDELQRDARFRGVCARIEDEVPPGLPELARRGIALDLDIAARHLPTVARIAEQAPELRIAIDHLAMPPYGAAWSDPWARAMEEAARLPQVCAKASGLLTNAPSPWQAETFRPWVRHALALFGPRRLMFGSDWPAALPRASWKESLAAFTQSLGALPTEVREELLGGAAERFYWPAGLSSNFPRLPGGK
ncbi:MAG: amidohydrolase family protein [Acidobacteriia bacterium]|nr:amidohydrolase family protein [Terriglobia bacterium]